MGHPHHHALSSVRRWGGVADDYIALHSWFDESKSITADFRHRALRHHAEGIFMAERFFGVTLTISTGRQVPVRLVGEQHVVEDLGFIPSFADWVRCIRPKPWMGRAQPIHRIVDPFASIRLAHLRSPRPMADYFTSFSCRLDVGSNENVDRAIALAAEFEDELGDEDRPSLGFKVAADARRPGVTAISNGDGFGEP